MSYHKFQAVNWICKCTPRCETMADCHNPQKEVSYHGSFEVFYLAADDIRERGWSCDPGWYWWACFPGCLPDGEPQGPYESEQEAIQAAQMEEYNPLSWRTP